MIYDRDNITIPILCPIQFSEPVNYLIYKQQNDYVQPIKSLNKIAILISEEVYNSSDSLTLKMINSDEVLISTFNFTKKQLSTGYYYATTEINSLGNSADMLVYFEIRLANVLLANSLYYSVSPTASENIKSVSFKNNTNEFDTIFSESVDTINIPIIDEYKIWFDSCVLTITESKYVITITKADLLDVDSMLSPIEIEYNGTDSYDLIIDGNATLGNFTVYFNDIADGNIHYVTVTADEEATEYVIEVNRNILEGRSIGIIMMTVIDNLVFVNSEYMTFGSSFTSENEFIIDIECGIKPEDQRDEQEVEDYIQQDMINETIYGDLYSVLPVTFGTSKGIPFWLATKINRASLCDFFYIDGEIYKRIKGSKMEKIEDTERGLAVYKIDFQIERNYSQ